jgi:hypothetical protein
VSVINWLFDAQLTFGDQHILWREIIGNAFGLASAVGGMRRRVWAWPVGIVGNVLLFTVFLGVAFDNPQGQTLYGQAGRQIFFIGVSIYGWYRWHETAKAGHSAVAVTPRWATGAERAALVLGGPLGRLVLGGHPRLGRLLDDLLADLVDAGVERGHGRRAGRAGLGPLGQLGEQRVECLHAAILAEVAAQAPTVSMAGSTGVGPAPSSR